MTTSSWITLLYVWLLSHGDSGNFLDIYQVKVKTTTIKWHLAVARWIMVVALPYLSTLRGVAVHSLQFKSDEMRVENYILKIAWGIVLWGFKGECYPFSNAAHALGFQKQKQREVVLKRIHVQTLPEEHFYRNVNLILPWLLFPLKQPSLTQLERGLFITVVTAGSLGFNPYRTVGNLSYSFFWNGCWLLRWALCGEGTVLSMRDLVHCPGPSRQS